MYAAATTVRADWISYQYVYPVRSSEIIPDSVDVSELKRRSMRQRPSEATTRDPG